jgi:hypothetical protein
MERTYSKQELMDFLTFIGDKGLVKYQTARGWRSAVSKLLGDLSEAEDADVRTVDIELAVHRTANGSSNTISPSSLKTYQHRVRTAIEEFSKWGQDPVNYKPRGLNKQKQNGDSKKTSNSKKPSNDSSQSASPSPRIKPEKEVKETLHSHGLNLSFPLRPDFLAQIVIPRDLNALEARRLGAFILTLSSDYLPE